MQVKRKPLGIVIILVIVAAGALGWRLIGRNRSRNALAEAQYQTVTVKRGQVSMEVEASGTVSAVDEVEVRPEIVGEITSIPVKEGDYVRKGQTLAVIDASDSRIELENARASYLSAVATLANLEKGSTVNEIEQARAALKQSEIAAASDQEELKRGEALYKEKLITKQQLDSLKNEALSSQEAVRSARAKLKELEEPASATDLASARSQVTATKLNWETLRNQYGNLSSGQYCVTAPVSGMILAINAEVGGSSKATGTSGQEIAFMAIIDPTKLEVDLDIDESDLAKVAIGQKASITFDALEGQTFSGKVTSISAQGTESDGVTTFNVTVSVDNPSGQIRTGMNAEAIILQERRTNVLVVPNNAVITRSGRSMVRVAGAGGRVEMKEVKTGAQDDDFTEITSGLLEGDKVLIGTKTKSDDSSSTSTKTNGLGGMGGPMGGPGGPMGGGR